MDVEKLATLYQRRYNIMSKIGKETDEILLAAERQDNVSLDLLLDLRQESLGELETNDIEIRAMVEESVADAKLFRSLTTGGEGEEVFSNKWERKVSELYHKVEAMLEEVKRKNKQIEFRAGRTKDYYAEKIFA